MDWITLNDMAQLDEIIESSTTRPVAIFKHSTRCSISSMAKGRLERSWNYSNQELPAYYLDLIAYRDISNKVAEQFGVTHESPQLLLLKNGEVVYHNSHGGIRAEALAPFID